MENMQKAQLNDTPDINVDLAENELDDILKRLFALELTKLPPQCAVP